jgi:hypothetical protein
MYHWCSEYLHLRKHEALETVGKSGDGRKVWRRQEVLGEAEDSGGNKYEALEAVEGSLEEIRGSGGRRRIWRRWKAVEAAGSSGGG